MLITTSLIYVLLSAPPAILVIIYWLSTLIRTTGATYSHVTEMTLCYRIAAALSNLVFAYNFYVYLITGKQFRTDLYKLFSRCIPSSCSCSSPPPPPPPAHPLVPIPPVAAAVVSDDAEIAGPVEADTAV